MVGNLIIVWFIGVVAFFVLWAVWAKVMQRISERKRQEASPSEEEVDKKESVSEEP